jgi:pantetheine-phosphate adenylyltransferase
VITAIYPGTFDPVTNGHVDVIERAAGIFDRLVIGVVANPQHKQPMFTLDERVAFLNEALEGLTNVEVDVFSELVVDFARRWEAKAIVKGLRVISDFEWEFQMNQLNRTLAPEVETVYVMASPEVSFVSSSGVKEIASFGGKVDGLVPAAVARRFVEMFPDGAAGDAGEPRGMNETQRLESLLDAGNGGSVTLPRKDALGARPEAEGSRQSGRRSAARRAAQLAG